ncbi:hypothetical protein SARC_11189 [Sphaeroforma arctica JP610]|uniref:Peptidase S1 domain-containing protein n=1 Tax=Sphaeroforma arctica JP610 TaxID=667725 RepID=A0A0L0FHP6_9EUKA|nr:hypothetical protein SARC_11189 [Sphaeroforma arctica JP610]KNC76302.1 hypothetical protein SARC_11189 [Sphaeroforma arctica JP610]|eukprot:XP_014150204.1 hypothetical protein SARC_11189 [Sphaeroforma arctica JP610]
MTCICEYIRSTIKFVYLVFFLGVPQIIARAVYEDGYTVQARVVGGSVLGEAVEWMASINNLEAENSHYCGGILVSAKWVLTAAHCFNIYKLNDTYLSHTVLLGKARIQDDIIFKHESKLKRIVCHPDFDSSTSENDICLVELTTPAVGIKTPRINADVTIPAFKQEVFYLGYGVQLQGSIDMSDDLRVVNVRTTSYQQCSAVYGTKQITSKHICTYANFKDTCQGDSGSPLMQLGGDHTFVNGVILGLVSYGRGCAIPGFPGVNTRISIYAKWIQEVLVNTQVTLNAETTGNVVVEVPLNPVSRVLPVAPAETVLKISSSLYFFSSKESTIMNRDILGSFTPDSTIDRETSTAFVSPTISG